METLCINIEFGGGTELLTATPKQKTHALAVPAWVDDAAPDGVPVTAPVNSNGEAAASEAKWRRADMRFLLQYVAHNVLVERPEMLVEGDGVRAGVLVLINDSDWELEGESAYVLQDGDSVAFISTLHGG